MPWRRERLPTPVFWPAEFHGLYSPWGRKESDTTQQLSPIVCLCGETRKRHKGKEIDESDTKLWEAAINMRTKIK